MSIYTTVISKHYTEGFFPEKPVDKHLPAHNCNGVTFLKAGYQKKKTGDLLARKNREVGSELIVNICVRRDQLVAYSFSPENIAFGG